MQVVSGKVLGPNVVSPPKPETLVEGICDSR